MKQSYRNITAISLMVLIIFSTIGFNVITTFCGGCHDEHISIALLPDDSDDTNCECCNDASNSQHCCAIDAESHQHKKHHHSTSIFARLSIDATEAKAKLHQLTTITIPLIAIQFEFIQPLLHPVFQYSNKPGFVLKTGRDILTHICVMRN